MSVEQAATTMDLTMKDAAAMTSAPAVVSERRERRRAPFVLRLISAVLLVGVSIVVTACIALAVMQRLGYQPYAVVSGSMEPEIPVGSLAIADSNVPYGGGLVGQVIAFRSAGGPIVVHRAVDSTEEGLVTQGDANDAADGSPVGPGNYIGAVKWYIPWAGMAFSMLGSLNGMIALAALIVASLLMRWAVRRWDRTVITTTRRVPAAA